MGPANQSKIFDVSKPHLVTPSASSRPLIVGHHPLMPDPMVLEEREQRQTPLSQEPAVSVSNLPTPDSDQFQSVPPPPSTTIPEPVSLESPERTFKTYNDQPQANNTPVVSDNMIKTSTEPSIIPSLRDHPQNSYESSAQITAQTPSHTTINPTIAPQNQEVSNYPAIAPASEDHAEHHHIIWLAIIITVFLALAVAAGIYVLNARNENSNNPVQSTAILWNLR